MQSQPLLSICIPTYNRASILEKTLESIVTSSPFYSTHDVEIVISDNCSTDNTYKVCERFTTAFPNKIYYYQTETNIGGDRNFYRVLSLAKGKCLKLNNDKCSFLPHTLATLLDIIEENKHQKYILFFPNKRKHIHMDNFVCKDLDSFISSVSYLATWIGGFSIWNTDFKHIVNATYAIDLHLLQTEILYRFLASGRNIKVYNRDLFSSLKTNDPILYNPAQVFGTNYLALMHKYVDKGLLSSATYEKEKRYVLFNLTGPLCVHYRKYGFHYWKGFLSYLYPLYNTYLYFYLWIFICCYKKFSLILYTPFEPLYLRYKLAVYTLLNKKEKAQKYRTRILERNVQVKENI